MLNCRDATRLMSEAQDRKLRLKEQLRLRVHWGICSGCRQFDEQMHLLHRIVRNYVHGDMAPCAEDDLS